MKTRVKAAADASGPANPPADEIGRRGVATGMLRGLWGSGDVPATHFVRSRLVAREPKELKARVSRVVHTVASALQMRALCSTRAR